MICPSCGGEYADWAHKCPYCGNVNENVDEQLYMQHLEDIKNRLDNTDEEAGELYKKHVFSSVRKVAVILIICAAVVTGIVIAVTAFSYYKGTKEEEQALDQLEWQREMFSKLDEWYEAGEYDKIVEEGYSLSLENSEYDIYGWEHYSFIFYCYSYYKEMCAAKDTFLAEGDSNVFYTENLLYCMFVAKYGCELFSGEYEDYGQDGSQITEEEYEKIKGYLGEVYDCAGECLGWTEAETDSCYSRCTDDDFGVVSYSACEELADEIFGEAQR